MVEEKYLNEHRLNAVLTEYEDLRDEIKRRIIGREALFVALMITMGAMVAFLLETRSYYYVVFLALITLLFIWHIFSSYTIHRIITFYIAKFIERRKLTPLLGWHDSRRQLNRRIGWIDFENFYEDSGMVVGIRIGLYVLFSVSILIISAIIVHWQTNENIIGEASSWLWWVVLFYWIIAILASFFVVKKYVQIRRMSLDLTRIYCRLFNLSVTVFLDRDGVINQDIIKMRRNQNAKGMSEYGITSWKDFRFERKHRRKGVFGLQRISNMLLGSRDVKTAIGLFNRVGWKVIIVTNQEVVGRGLMSKKELDDIHDRMLRRLRARLTRRNPSAMKGREITDIFYCPHHPGNECVCRKPKPGLFRQAAHRYGIRPDDSWMIGDSNRDIASARLFGCNSILLTTTHDLEYLRRQKDWIEPTHVSADLLSAAEWLIRNFDIGEGENRD